MLRLRLQKALLLISVLGFVFFAHPTWAQIAFDAGATNPVAAAHTNTSWSHTLTGADLCLVVGFGLEDQAGNDITPDYVQVASTSLTQAKRQVRTGSILVDEIWFTCSPPSGAQTIQVHYNQTAADAAIVSSSYTGGDDLGATASGEDASGNATVSITSTVADSMLIDMYYRTTCQTDPGTGQTSNGQAAAGRCGQSSRELTTSVGAYTMDWTGNPAGAWITAAIEITPAAAAAGAPLDFFPQSWWFFFLWGLSTVPYEQLTPWIWKLKQLSKLL